MAVAQQAARLAVVECKAAAQPAVPEQMPAACKVAAACKAAVARPVAPEQTAAACKVAARRAVDLPAALQVAVECRAAVLQAAVAPQVELAPWVAAVIRRPGAGPPVVAAPKEAKVAVLAVVAIKVRRAAALETAAVVAAVR